MEDISGTGGSHAPAEEPTPAAELAIVLLVEAFGPDGRKGSRENGRKGSRERRLSQQKQAPRMRAATPPAVLGTTPDPATQAPAEAPTSAAVLKIVLLPCSSSRPRPGGMGKRRRISRPWTQPPGAGPP